MPDTHLLPLPLPQDPLTMERINVRVRTAEPDMTAMFHRFDAARFEWLAAQLHDADRPQAAKLALSYAAEHRETAAKLEELAA